MSTDLEKALEKAKYSALPLPRAKSNPTTIFAFEDGHLFIVRNPHTCLPDPPLAVTVDPAVDALAFTREFKLEFNAVVSFLMKVFGVGNAKAELSVKSISSATIQMGGLSHHTVQTGELIDFLMKQDQTGSCLRDIFDKDHFTIIAALQASAFTYTFKNERGVVVKFTGAEANALFQAQAGMDISVTSEGKVVVNSPCFVGVITWDGKRITQEVEKARKFKPGLSIRAYEAPHAIANACSPQELRDGKLRSLKSAQGATKRKAYR